MIKTKKKLKVSKLIDIKFNIDKFIHLFCFISVLFIGADIFSVNVGVHFRLDQIFLVVLWVLLLIKGGYHIEKNRWLLAFTLFSFVSIFFSTSFMRGVMFYCSIVYNIIFVFYNFASYIRTYGLIKFIKIFRQTCYVQAAIFFLQYFLLLLFNYEIPFMPNYGYVFSIPRFKLWFYEPSYFATYISFWLTISFYMFLVNKQKNYLIDFLLCLFMLILCTATTGFIAIALCIIVVYFLWLFKKVTLKKLLFPIFCGFMILIFYFAFKDIFDFFVGRLFNRSMDVASGGRITLWLETWKVFCDNPLFGVGPGNYGLYLGQAAGYVPSNVTLELMSTLGIFSTIAFYGLSFSLSYQAIRLCHRTQNDETQLLVACVLGLTIFTIVLQINQGYLRLYHWMFFAIIYGGIKNNIRKNIKSKRR